METSKVLGLLLFFVVFESLFSRVPLIQSSQPSEQAGRTIDSQRTVCRVWTIAGEAQDGLLDLPQGVWRQ